MIDIHDQAEAYLIHDGAKILDVNAACAKLFRTDPAGLIGLEIFDLLADEDLRLLGKLRMKVALSGRNVPDVIYIFERRDGTQFWGEGHTEPIGTGRYVSRITLKVNLT